MEFGGKAPPSKTATSPVPVANPPLVIEHSAPVKAPSPQSAPAHGGGGGHEPSGHSGFEHGGFAGSEGGSVSSKIA